MTVTASGTSPVFIAPFRLAARFFLSACEGRVSGGRPSAIRRVARVCAIGAVALFAGCGVMRNKDGVSPSQSGNAIERVAEKGPVKLFVRVWPREPRLSDLVEMEIRVESQPGIETKPPAFGKAVGDFLVRDYSERPAEATAANVRRFHYQLEPVHAGKHLIRSVSIEFVDKRPNSERRSEPALVETDPLEVNVTSELGNEAPSLANLEPMLPPRPVSQTFATGWLVALGLAGLLAASRGRSLSPPQATADRTAPPDS